MDIQRLIAAVIFTFSGLMLWEAWQKQNAPKIPVNAPTASSTPAAVGTPGAAVAPATPGAASSSPAVPMAAPLGAVAAKGEPVRIGNDKFELELSTLGADIRRVTFKEIGSAVDRNKPLVLLQDDPKNLFITQSGLVGEGLPNHKSTYALVRKDDGLASGRDTVEAHFSYKDPSGIEVEKTYRLKRGSYEIAIETRLRNTTSAPIAPTAYYHLLRDANPPTQDASQTNAFAGIATFTGFAVYTDEGKFAKVEFKDVEKGKAAYPKAAKDGWIGMVQHYFVSSWLPKPGAPRDYYIESVGENLFRGGVKESLGSIAPGASAIATMNLYIGPQETDRLEKIAPGLDLVVDYGWLHIIAKPLFVVLSWIHSWVGNWGWAIILLTIMIKLVFYPLNAKAGRSMAQMRVLAPKMEKLKQLYGDDKQKMNLAMMELYKTEKINPLGGCLPIVVQIPVFIALYWVLLSSIELRHAPWIGWIQDLSAADPYYILPVIYAVSMFVQTKLNPQPADPVQAKVMLAMPIVFSIFFFFFPAGLVLYWVVQNLLSIVQQWHINRTIERETQAKAKTRR
jgi:YidC/Oxa1 family membrane protein insertase